jgi:hypothetical protein
MRSAFPAAVARRDAAFFRCGRRLQPEFHGARITSDVGLLAALPAALGSTRALSGEPNDGYRSQEAVEIDGHQGMSVKPFIRFLDELSKSWPRGSL